MLFVLLFLKCHIVFLSWCLFFFQLNLSCGILEFLLLVWMGFFFFFFCPFNWSMTGRKLLICICLFCFQTTYYIFPSFSSIESSRLRGRSFPDKDHFISFQYFLVSFICGTYRLLGLLLKPLSGVKTTSWWASEPWLSWVTWSRLRFIAEAAVASEPGGTGCFLVS